MFCHDGYVLITKKEQRLGVELLNKQFLLYNMGEPTDHVKADSRSL